MILTISVEKVQAKHWFSNAWSASDVDDKDTAVLQLSAHKPVILVVRISNVPREQVNTVNKAQENKIKNASERNALFLDNTSSTESGRDLAVTSDDLGKDMPLAVGIWREALSRRMPPLEFLVAWVQKNGGKKKKRPRSSLKV